ncbi:MFS transporter [Pectobacterium carotovorum subsp. carotovorum]|uniref:MFS transporter n=1 Tax=Pectobacterium versatile TaxID=2488639 RepID=UPI001F3404BB|nr:MULTISPECIES: MFS transporter [Pectobacterium]MCL6333507.1 MFS transporter [Pectobacterium carotovorum subsp. carotovorum]MCL6345273.1 MFS transporter [Pectobacterium carotovorum subsp. carotovorum]MCL6362701.1 MFS transporter [Pectobacterium carotovorum subsp. carotovorum]MCL6400966.1 MFS transporter [Pectobacterium carotovorum subsp. carotovorum]
MTINQPDEPDQAKPGITLTLALAILSASLGTSIANIALPTLTAVFSAPFAQVQAVVIAYLAAMALSVVIAGRLGDRYGLKPVFITGLGLFAIASLLCAIAPQLWSLIGARALQGIGAAFLMTLGMALLRQTAGEKHVGRAMGIVGTVSALGTALGPSVGGFLLAIAGWRSLFWIQIPLVTIVLFMAFTLLPATPVKEKASLSGGLSLRNTTLLSNLTINAAVTAVIMTTLIVGPYYLGLGLGLKETLVGLVMAIGPAVATFSGIPSGRLVDTWGFRRALTAGLSLVVTGTFMLAILPNLLGVTGYILAIIVLTPGYQLFQAANNTATLAEVPGNQRGTVSGLLNLSRNIGLIAGASIMGQVFALGVGTEDFTHAAPASLANGMQLTFFLAGAMVLVAIAFTRLPKWKQATR